MSDFFQHGLISTLHQLNERPLQLELPSGRAKLGLILPCHYRDLASDGLTSIIQALNRLLDFVDSFAIRWRGMRADDRLCSTASDRKRLGFRGRFVMRGSPSPRTS
jgi:hypothetical protein